MGRYVEYCVLLRVTQYIVTRSISSLTPMLYTPVSCDNLKTYLSLPQIDPPLLPARALKPIRIPAQFYNAR